MARKKRVTLSREEFVSQAAELVAVTINPDAMGITPEEVDIDLFIFHFKTKALEMLDTKSSLLISIGPDANPNGNDVFSEDMQIILDYIEMKMQTKFLFFYGLLALLGNDSLVANWVPH